MKRRMLVASAWVLFGVGAPLYLTGSQWALLLVVAAVVPATFASREEKA